MEVLFEHVEAGTLLLSLVLGIILTCSGFSIRSRKVKTVLLLLGLVCFVITAVCVHIVANTDYSGV